jgi:hypothetical protein
MVEPDPIGRDLSRARAKRRLAPGAACLLCGERDTEVLEKHPASSVPASVLELHHLAGRRNDPNLTVVLCLNCHRRISARMAFAGVDLGRDPTRTTEERLVSLLRGLAVFFEQLAEALMLWAHQLAASIRDERQPQGGTP